ncbi:MAG: hypothetical protein QM500_19590 [Methylococcales bacterium]
MERPVESYGPHDESDRVDHCMSCEAENSPQKEDVCPLCGEESHLISTWGEWQAERLRNGERYNNNGPQFYEDGPQPVFSEVKK